jgi:hypothetical protein
MGVGTNYNPRIVTEDLVLCLDAANPKSYPGSGTAWTDLSGNGNNGTLVNGVGYSADNKGSMVFDGTNDNVTNNTWNNMKGANWNGFITMEGIFKTNTSPTNTVMGYFGFSSSNSYFKFMNTTNLFLDCGTVVPSRIITTCISNFSNFFGSWVHVCGVYDGTAKTYFNGILQNTSSSFILDDISSTNFSVGLGMGYFPFQGNIGNVRLYNRALTATEIAQNFNATRGRYGI